MVMMVVMFDFDPLLGFIVARLGYVIVVVMLIRSVYVDHFLHFGTLGGRVLLVLSIVVHMLVRFGDGVLRATIVALRIPWFHWVHMNLAHFSVAFFDDVETWSIRGRLLVRAIDIITIGLGRTESHSRRYCNRCKYHQTKSLYD